LFLHDDEQQDDSDVMVVELVDLEKDSDVTESSQGSKVPSSGTAAKQRRATYLYRPPISGKTNAAPKDNKSVLEMLRKTLEEC
jgi:prolyl oligopeptidase PreP (S9A serine peptidase family)